MSDYISRQAADSWRKKLYAYQDQKRKIAEAEEQLKIRFDVDAEKIMALKSSLILPAIAADGMPHAHNAKDRVAEVLAEIDLILGRARDRFQAVMNMRDEAAQVLIITLGMIQKVNDATLRMLLFYRYVRGFTWYEVTDALAAFEGRPYSEPYIRNNLHGKALAAFEEVNK